MPKGKNDVVEAAQRGLTRLESLLKMAAGLLVLVAGMGVPAVYVQFRNYGIPTDFVTYGEVLRAGAVPSALLTLVAVYLAWVTRKAVALPNLKESPIMTLLLLPIVLPTIAIWLALVILMIVGSISLCLLWFAPAIRASMRVIGGHDPTQQQVLLAFLVLVLLLTLASYLFTRSRLFPRSGLRRWMPELSSRQAGTWIVRLIENHWRRAEASGISLAFLLLWTAGSTVLGSVFNLIWMRAAFRTWLPQYATVLTGGRIAAVALTTTLLVFLFFTVFFVGRKLKSDHNVQRRQGVWLAAGTVVLGYLLCAVLYSTSIYPTLWRGLGGGRPIPVTVWLEGESLTSSLRGTMAGVTFHPEGQVVRCDGLLLLQSSSDWFVFVGGAPKRQGLVVPRSGIKMLTF
jgi:hypothetical protein